MLKKIIIAISALLILVILGNNFLVKEINKKISNAFSNELSFKHDGYPILNFLKQELSLKNINYKNISIENLIVKTDYKGYLNHDIKVTNLRIKYEDISPFISETFGIPVFETISQNFKPDNLITINFNSKISYTNNNLSIKGNYKIIDIGELDLDISILDFNESDYAIISKMQSNLPNLTPEEHGEFIWLVEKNLKETKIKHAKINFKDDGLKNAIIRQTAATIKNQYKDKINDFVKEQALNFNINLKEEGIVFNFIDKGKNYIASNDKIVLKLITSDLKSRYNGSRFNDLTVNKFVDFFENGNINFTIEPVPAKLIYDILVDIENNEVFYIK